MILVPILLLHLAGFHAFSLMQNFPSDEFMVIYLYFPLLVDNWIVFSLGTNRNNATVNILYIFRVHLCVFLLDKHLGVPLLNDKGMHITTLVVDFVRVFQRACIK